MNLGGRAEHETYEQDMMREYTLQQDVQHMSVYWAMRF
jgi:hypothetical protein